nr:potassium voltage-gated channel subfamily E member 3 isoform X2 [Zootoca vivipara]
MEWAWPNAKGAGAMDVTLNLAFQLREKQRLLPTQISVSSIPASKRHRRGSRTLSNNGTPWDRTMASALGNLTETWLQKLDSMMEALNQTLSHVCPQDAKPVEEEEDNSYSYVYILFVMILFAVTVGGLILGYTRSRKEVDKQSDPYHVYIKNRVSMI